MSDIHYIKIIARNRNINPMKDDTIHRKNTGFLCGTGSPYYMGKLTFSALIKDIFFEKITKDKISCAKNFISVLMKPWPLNANQIFKMKNIIALV